MYPCHIDRTPVSLACCQVACSRHATLVLGHRAISLVAILHHYLYPNCLALSYIFLHQEFHLGTWFQCQGDAPQGSVSLLERAGHGMTISRPHVMSFL